MKQSIIKPLFEDVSFLKEKNLEWTRNFNCHTSENNTKQEVLQKRRKWPTDRTKKEGLGFDKPRLVVVKKEIAMKPYAHMRNCPQKVRFFWSNAEVSVMTEPLKFRVGDTSFPAERKPDVLNQIEIWVRDLPLLFVVYQATINKHLDPKSINFS